MIVKMFFDYAINFDIPAITELDEDAWIWYNFFRWNPCIEVII